LKGGKAASNPTLAAKLKNKKPALQQGWSTHIDGGDRKNQMSCGAGSYPGQAMPRKTELPGTEDWIRFAIVL